LTAAMDRYKASQELAKVQDAIRHVQFSQGVPKNEVERLQKREAELENMLFTIEHGGAERRGGT